MEIPGKPLSGARGITTADHPFSSRLFEVLLTGKTFASGNFASGKDLEPAEYGHSFARSLLCALLRSFAIACVLFCCSQGKKEQKKSKKGQKRDSTHFDSTPRAVHHRGRESPTVRRMQQQSPVLLARHPLFRSAAASRSRR